MDTLNDEQFLQTVTLESTAGLRADVLNLGATLRSLDVPTAAGRVNVVPGYADLDDYRADTVFMGVTAGPFANRIGDARFSLGDAHYELDANEDATGHCLHGGSQGLHRQRFSLRTDPGRRCVACRTVLPSGQGGFPGEREGYAYLQNTDTKRELEHFAMFLTKARDYGRSIGFEGTFLIEPKPMEPMYHQYDFDAQTVIGFLREYDLAASNGEPDQLSGKQELMENLINDAIMQGC